MFNMGINWAFSLNIQDSFVQYSLFSFLFLTFERDIVQTVVHNTGNYTKQTPAYPGGLKVELYFWMALITNFWQSDEQ